MIGGQRRGERRQYAPAGDRRQGVESRIRGGQQGDVGLGGGDGVLDARARAAGQDAHRNAQAPQPRQPLGCVEVVPIDQQTAHG
ncbi:MAG TPA: hypothetical protein VMM15_31220 [Bradyrhizobium sp.]|nr:hypothetical protein [Bradyrhizobium sp.]